MRQSPTRRTTLPRVRPAPEHNIIQNPELLQRAANRLGLRQSSIAPALADGVQLVVLLDDISTRAGTTKRNYVWSATRGGNVASGATFFLEMPILAGKTARVSKIWFSASTLNAPFTIEIFQHILTPPFVFPIGGMVGCAGSELPTSQDYGLQLQPQQQVDKPTMLTFTGNTATMVANDNARSIARVQVSAIETLAQWLMNFDDLVLRAGTYISFHMTDTLANGVLCVGAQWSEENTGDAR